MKKFNLRNIMLKAWELFRKAADLTFSECLHRAWLSAKAVEKAHRSGESGSSHYRGNSNLERLETAWL